MKDSIVHSVNEAVFAINVLQREESITFIEKLARSIIRSFQQGGKLLIAGNGGSLCDAMHFAEELTGFYHHKRRALPAIALSDPGHMSCTANDMGYEYVFSRAIEALGSVNDLFIALTTSGNSQNLLEGLKKAKELGIKTVCFLGKTGGKMKGLADLEWIVSGFTKSDRIQEVHMAAIHIVIEIVEKTIFSQSKEKISEKLCEHFFQ